MSTEQQYALLIDSENISSRYIKTIFDELTKLQGKMTQIPCHCRGIPLAKGVKWGYNLLDNVFMFFGENER